MQVHCFLLSMKFGEKWKVIRFAFQNLTVGSLRYSASKSLCAEDCFLALGHQRLQRSGVRMT